MPNPAWDVMAAWRVQRVRKKRDNTVKCHHGVLNTVKDKRSDTYSCHHGALNTLLRTRGPILIHVTIVYITQTSSELFQTQSMTPQHMISQKTDQ